MRVLLTRPRQDAEPLARQLQENGIETMIEPLLSIELDRAQRPDLSGVQAVLATSANGVRALAELSAGRDVPVLAVGDATARAARAAGFPYVESAAGDVQSLAALAAARCKPEQGPLLHVAGHHRAGDLEGLIEAQGLAYRRAVLYAAQPAEGLSAEARSALATGKLEGILFFSPRTAGTFVSLARQENVAEACRGLDAFCLSEAVAEQARALEWRRVLVAPRPDQASLVTLLTDQIPGPWGTMTDTPKTPSEPAESHEAADETAAADSQETPPGEPAETPPADDGTDASSAPAGEPAAAVPAATQSSSRGGVVGLAVLSSLLLLAVIGGVLYAAWPFWSPYVEDYVQTVQRDPAPDSRVGELAERVSALEKTAPAEGASGDAFAEMERSRAEISAQVATLLERLAQLEQNLEAVRTMVTAGNLPGQAADARRALDELSDRIAKLEQSAPTGQLDAELDDLQSQNARLQESMAVVAHRVDELAAARTEAVGALQSARDLVLAAGQLRETLRTSAAFADELAALRKAAGEQPDLSRLIVDLMPYASSGIPVLATLRDRFDATARQVTAAANGVEGGDWLAAAANRLSSLVTIRRTGPAAAAADDGVDAALARAEAALADGDLVAAVKALEGLQGPAAEAAAEWLRQARARVLAERAMAVLHVHTTSLLTPAAQ